MGERGEELVFLHADTLAVFFIFVGCLGEVVGKV
jgi:hypothetical protein